MDYIQNTEASSNANNERITNSIQVTLKNKITYCNSHSYRGFVMECQAHTQNFSERERECVCWGGPEAMHNVFGFKNCVTEIMS